MSHACHRFWKYYKILTFCSLLTRCTVPCTCQAKRRFNVQKWRIQSGALYMFTSKCASRHNSVHFFDISTSKSGPELVCFVHFDFKMCFAPQRRALFRHRNFQKWSEREVLFSFLNCKCASRHNGVQFFISHLARWLRSRRFSEPSFRPSGAKSLKKQSVSRLSCLFAHLDPLSSATFSF